MSEDVLGTPKPWQIKDFPEGLRNRIISAARDANQSVAEYVTGVMVRHLDGAATGPDARVNGFANRVNHPGLNPSELAGLMQGMAALTTATGTPPAKADARRAYALVDDHVRAARGMPPRPIRLPKPRPQARIEGAVSPLAE